MSTETTSYVRLIPKANGERYSVLLAEDKDLHQMMARLIFDQLDCKLDIAKDGDEAFEKFKAKKYDIIFMDCGMPIKDGLSTTQKIRNYEKEQNDGRHIPIIALTAWITKQDRDDCLLSGMDGHITKPPRKEKLVEAMNNFCEHAGVVASLKVNDVNFS